MRRIPEHSILCEHTHAVLPSLQYILFVAEGDGRGDSGEKSIPDRVDSLRMVSEPKRTRSGEQDILRLVVLVVGVLLLAPLLMMVFMMPMMGMMGWWWGDGMMGGMSPLWGIGMMLFWLVVLLGIGYALYRGVASGVGPASKVDPALEELRMAYARGELTEEEFEERREQLQQHDYT